MRALQISRRRRAVLALCCTAIAWFASTSDGVSAASNIPNELISSNPQPNATVTVVPTQLQLVFRNKLDADDAASLGVLLRCSGTTVSLGSPVVAVDAQTVSAPLASIPPAGQCTVTWVINRDIGSLGTFNFTLLITTQTTIAADTDTTQTTIVGEIVSASTTPEPRLGLLLGLVRILEYLFVACVFGGLLYIVIGWPEGFEYDTTQRFLRLSWFGALGSMFLVVALNSARGSGDSFVASLNPFAWFGGLNSASGIVLLLRFILIAGAAVVAFAPRRILQPETQVPTILYLLAMVATYRSEEHTSELQSH